ncbi:MAG: hypothetical protein ACM3UY_03185 [Methanocella sp.]
MKSQKMQTIKQLEAKITKQIDDTYGFCITYGYGMSWSDYWSMFTVWDKDIQLICQANGITITDLDDTLVQVHQNGYGKLYMFKDDHSKLVGLRKKEIEPDRNRGQNDQPNHEGTQNRGWES